MKVEGGGSRQADIANTKRRENGGIETSSSGDGREHKPKIMS